MIPATDQIRATWLRCATATLTIIGIGTFRKKTRKNLMKRRAKKYPLRSAESDGEFLRRMRGEVRNMVVPKVVQEIVSMIENDITADFKPAFTARFIICLETKDADGIMELHEQLKGILAY